MTGSEPASVNGWLTDLLINTKIPYNDRERYFTRSRKKAYC